MQPLDAAPHPTSLVNCCFCGSDMPYLAAWNDGYCVHCPECDARGPIKHRELAIQLWNTKVAS